MMALSVVNKYEATGAAAGHVSKASWSLHGHDDEVLSAAARKNLFATCSADGVSLLWRLPDTAKGPENVCKLSTGGPAALDVCFVDDRRIATAQGDATVSLWDIETGKRLTSLSRVKVPGRSSWPVINAVAMAAEEILAFGGDDGYLSFVDCRSPSISSSINRKTPITALAATDGSLFSGDACGRVCGFDQRMSWRRFMDLKCAADAVSSVACGAKGGVATVYTMDSRLSLVDTQPFAVDEADRLLASVDVNHGQGRTLMRGDWCGALDAAIVPTADGTVACVGHERFSAGATRFLNSADGGGDEEGGGELYFSIFVQDRYALFGGSGSLTLREW